ncbi:MAG: penicillin-binding protein [Intrasporangium sp.]|uniref:transglycosylase domain-containing protein n=1 Tax=Intrasporangium sp. TaxID=1925024 RepID=UPI0026471C1D|nr:transglycosylase domain-containing protein [Intrasporangium sp.]MDN5795825.1 penicillin-binding protein [Intrasporangium sp.]
MARSRHDGQAATEKQRKDKPERTGWRRWAIPTLKWGSLAILALFVISAIGVTLAYARMTIPKPNDLASAQLSIVYYSDGTTELDRISAAEGNRESVPLSQVPKHVQDAHLAAEDRTFWTNSGISIPGILRAVKTGITGEAQVGGSTITQQYVKNYFLTQDRTLSRKGREILLAVKIDNQMSKEQILEDYLNTIYYGRGAYGIQSAARTYFGKDVSELTVGEGAVLASIMNAPERYDPANGDEALANLESRYSWVLDGMVSQGWLTAAERAEWTELPAIKPRKANTYGSGPTGYITAEVRKELNAVGLSDKDIDQGGLRITTTIDKKAQDAAVTAMKDNLPDKVEGGLVAIKPGDGAVVAMYGGADYEKSQWNSATQAILQAGSNFKPFALLAAVRDGVSTRTQFNGNSPEKFGDVTINNFGHVSYGMVDMRRMVGRSINTAFVALNEQIGPAKTKQAAIDAGIPADTAGLDATLTNVLGTSSPHVIDMASAYSTIASQGVRSTPYLVKSATSTTSGFTYLAKPETKRAFDKDVTADVTDAMTYTVKPGGTATKLQGLNRPVAGKTGTSEENRSVWFSGFVPQLAVSIGMYKPDAAGNPTTMTDAEGYNLTGGTIPADIFMEFMQPTLEGVEVVPFPDRTGVGDDKVASTPPVRPTTQTPTQTPTPTGTPTTTAPTAPSTRTVAPPKPTFTRPPTRTGRPTFTVPTPPRPEARASRTRAG